MSQEIYCCPLQSTAFENCQGCPLKLEDGGKIYCCYATRNFIFTGKAAELGVFPIVHPREVYRAELRYATENGRRVMQLNIADLEGTKETSQVPLDGIATDSLPRFKRRRR